MTAKKTAGSQAGVKKASSRKAAVKATPAKASTARKVAAKKAAATKAAPSKAAAVKKAAASSSAGTAAGKGSSAKAPAKAPAGKRAAEHASATSSMAKGGGPRDDYGSPTDAYFARQPADKRALLETLRALVRESVPDAESVIKWGVPFYEINGVKVCALAAFKDSVALNLFGPPDAFVDPGTRLEGASQGNRTLKVRRADEIDRASIVRWLKAAADNSR